MHPSHQSPAPSLDAARIGNQELHALSLVAADPLQQGLATRLAELLPFSSERLLEFVSDNLLDHMPRAYPVDIWNDFVEHGDR